MKDSAKSTVSTTQAGRTRLIVSASLLVAACLGFYVGCQWQIVRDYETYVFPFSRYSWHLRDLAERQDLTALTNDIITFDKLFNARQNPNDLRDAVNKVFKYGKYFPLQTNNIETPHKSVASPVNEPVLEK